MVYLVVSATPAESLDIIAHRGASQYLPEHSLAGLAMAHGMGADYLEADLVQTADGHLVVLHDITLDHTTDVRSVFVGRARSDGLHYVSDFTLEEIGRLSLYERRDPQTGEAVFAGRYPVQATGMRVPSFAEWLDLVYGMNTSTGRKTGIYLEIKELAHHRREGLAILQRFVSVLEAHPIFNNATPVLIQSFESEALGYLKRHLPRPVPLVQLVLSGPLEGCLESEPSSAQRLGCSRELARIAGYADLIGVPYSFAVTEEAGLFRPTPLTRRAAEQGLEVHVFTVRADLLATRRELVALLAGLEEAEVTGIFTDSCDELRQFWSDTSKRLERRESAGLLIR